MERAVQMQLLAFITENGVLSAYQSGFRKKYSTETAIVHLVDSILEKMDNRLMTGAVFIDLKKAFDLVDHKYLLHKLENYGVRGSSLDWFRNYLTTRTQRTQYGKELSSSLPVYFGVPQGSVLGPLLFVLHINDLPNCLENCSIGLYADDTVIYFTGISTIEIIKAMQDYLDRVAQWMDENSLLLNYSKTETVLFGTRQKLEKAAHFSLTLHQKTIKRVSTFKYLGVLLDEQLSWKEHTEVVSKKVCKRLGLLSRIRACLTIEASKCVYNSIVQPLFDYAETAWGELSIGCSQELQRLQNRAPRIILKRNTSKNTFGLLNWVNLNSRRNIHKCILVYKCINNMVPEYLCSYFLRNSNFHNYNTRRRHDLHIPKPNRNLGKRTFRYSATVCFNTLPAQIKDCTSLNIFKHFIFNYFYSGSIATKL